MVEICRNRAWNWSGHFSRGNKTDHIRPLNCYLFIASKNMNGIPRIWILWTEFSFDVPPTPKRCMLPCCICIRFSTYVCCTNRFLCWFPTRSKIFGFKSPSIKKFFRITRSKLSNIQVWEIDHTAILRKFILKISFEWHPRLGPRVTRVLTTFPFSSWSKNFSTRPSLR